MKQRIKTLILLFVGSFLIDIVTMPLRGFAFVACSTTSFIAYFIFTWWAIAKLGEKVERWKIFIAILCGFLALNLPVRIDMWSTALVSLPDFAMHLLGIFMGAIFAISAKWGRGVTAVLSLAMLLSINWVTNRHIYYVSHGTYSYERCDDVSKATIVDEHGVKVDMQGSLMVLDFWNKGCGYCFQAFPEYQKLFEKYGDKVRFYAVDITDDVGNQEDIALVREEGHTFPIAFISREEARNLFGITRVPNVVVVNPEGKMLFLGSVESCEQYIKDN